MPQRPMPEQISILQHMEAFIPVQKEVPCGKLPSVEGLTVEHGISMRRSGEDMLWIDHNSILCLSALLGREQEFRRRGVKLSLGKRKVTCSFNVCLPTTKSA